MTTAIELSGNATYSPEDNKLRLYPFARLARPIYDRLKEAGFKWAPKQELFVAPMWTPERAALLEELAGDIGDEDTSLVERAEIRAGRFDEYSDKRASESAAASAAVKQLADGIPLGQPILVGHHSEKRARKDAAKIENGMRKAVKLWSTATYWKARAEGALAHAAYKELPSVRMRRIKVIEADLRKVQRNHTNTTQRLALWEKLPSPNSVRKKDGSESTFLDRARYVANHEHISRCYPLADFPRDPPASQYEGPMGLWSALDGGVITPDQARDFAMDAHARYLEVAAKWIEHYEFRLAYERAMLGEQVKETPKYEKGGACQCWASPGRFDGGWSYIQKVNKVSVTVLDNWGNGGKNFPRTIPFDKLTAVMSAGDVVVAREAGRLHEVATGIGFLLRDTTPAALAPVADEPMTSPEIEAMRASLAAGVQVAVAPQLFPTPAAIAEQMARAADLEPGQRVLEPSAGTGNLVAAILSVEPRAHVLAIELNSSLSEGLSARWQGMRVISGDFLAKGPEELGGQVDRIVMNPPYVGGADIHHVRHAWSILRPGGRLVALCAHGPRQARELGALADEHAGTFEPLPDGSFAEQGTQVRIAMLVLDKPS